MAWRLKLVREYLGYNYNNAAQSKEPQKHALFVKNFLIIDVLTKEMPLWVMNALLCQH